MRKQTRWIVAALAVILAVPAAAQDWPARPVNIVAPFAAGGNVDITARIVAENLQPLLGQPVIVENKTGAGSMIGSEAVARAAPDGYTLLMTSASLTNSPALFSRYPYDWQKDFRFSRFAAHPPHPEERSEAECLEGWQRAHCVASARRSK